ncbi:adenosylcobinamide-GDP ribazoletransferase [Paenibacillus sp. FSL R7-0312]|uniref:adenosylcobinamide-GDP ribazoletransferase n=1 Tax=Paenibacillus sp. FSL R7-0312 TaxID=2921682 RepID=UPI0030F7A487
MSARGDAAAAFQFLSRFPVKYSPDFSPELLRRSVVYYPLVGAAIGLSAALGAAAAAWLLPAWPAAVITLILWVGLTGGLHLDGWMDSADALLSYRSRERMLEIMKDSRVGAMGVLACVLLLLLKASLLAALIEGGSYSMLPLLLLPPIWSRWYMVRAMARYPLARGNEGLAASFGGLPAWLERRARLSAALLTLAAPRRLWRSARAAGPGRSWRRRPSWRRRLRRLRHARSAADRQPARRAHRRRLRRAG